MALTIPVKGTVVSSSNKWIYNWLGIQAVCPADVERALAKANGEDVIVEINSGGGEVFSGFEIYTLIKQFVGNIEIHIVGLAGSAASVIAMAATCKISPVGMIMIHNSFSYAEGDYREMDVSSGMLQAVNSSIRLAYMSKSNLSENELVNLMDNETWMNAKRAIDDGFADSMLFEDEEEIAEPVFSPVASVNDIVLSQKIINRIKSLKAENKLDEIDPESILTENNEVTVSNNANEPAQAGNHIENKNEGEDSKMTYAELLKEHPEIEDEVNKLVTDAENRGVQNERGRLQAIDEISANIESNLIHDAKYGENPVTAEQLALQAIKNNKQLGDAYMKNALDDSKASGVDDVPATPTDEENEDDKLADIAANAANQKRKVVK